KTLSQAFNSASFILFDHYQTVVQQSPEEIMAWIDAGANYNTFQLPQLATDLASLKQGQAINNPITGETIKATPIIFFETLFGYAHQATGQYIGQLIWLDTPLDVAFARTIKSSNLQMFNHINNPQFSKEAITDVKKHCEWMDNYINNYIQFVSKTLHIQQQQVRPTANIQIFATNNTEDIHAKAYQFIQDNIS
ncbi:MAG: hypothetical protein KAT04_03990, partial [Methylococcales bacterium]|nr:hypothetical protein [Methylococcales bacterium]